MFLFGITINISQDLFLLMYSLDNGIALTPCATTLKSTVTKTAKMNVSCPGNEPSLSKAIRANTIDASPLGPNHPMNKTESQLTLVPNRDMPTGSIRITVKLKIAYTYYLPIDKRK